MIDFIFVDNIVFESSVIFRGSRNINTFKNTCISLKVENSFRSKYMYSVKLFPRVLTIRNEYLI